MFFRKAKTTETPKGRSMLGMLFNPDIGASLRPLGETTSAFVKLIAMVFAINGLFPKNHSALTGEDPNPKLTLHGVLSTAWHGLSFTKTGAPKVALFFAVLAGLVIAVLSLFTALLAGFIGHAHAASGPMSFFQPVNVQQDIAQNFIDYLFKGVPLSSNFLQTGTQSLGTDTSLPCALVATLGFYSEAMLVVAAFILFYHLVAMVAHTAHDGVVMGKSANQVWAPIRLVFAIGLLVPVGSAGTGQCNGQAGVGLNSGQYIVIKMAEWGSGLASQAWSQFLQALAKQYTYVPPNEQYIGNFVREMAVMEACRYLYNFDKWSLKQSAQGLTPTIDTYIGGSFDPSNMTAVQDLPQADGLAGSGQQGFSYGAGNGNTTVQMQASVCGGFILQDPPSGGDIANQIRDKIAEGYGNVVMNHLPHFAALGQNIAYFVPGSPLNDGSDPPSSKMVVDEIVSFQTDMESAVDSVMSSTTDTDSLALQVNNFSGYGWVTAGAWLNTIANIQGRITSAGKDVLPSTDVHIKDDISGKPAFGSFMKWLFTMPVVEAAPSAPSPMSLGSDCTSGSAGSLAVQAVGERNTTIGELLDKNKKDGKFSLMIDTKNEVKDLMNMVGGAGFGEDMEKGLLDMPTLGESDIKEMWKKIDGLAVANGLWDQTGGGGCGDHIFSLGAQLHTNRPFAEIADWGYRSLMVTHALLEVVWRDSKQLALQEILVDVGRFMTPNDPRSKNGYYRDLMKVSFQQKESAWKISLATLAAWAFFMAGFQAAFIVPLLPFFRYFFNILTWIVSLMEAVIAVPLVALAHLNPGGEGLAGQSAKSAYFMIFNIFLRPILMVFGLIFGLILFTISLVLLNATYALAVNGTNGNLNGQQTQLISGIPTIGRLIFTLIYGACVYVCANNCFKPIGAFPEYALRWIGQSAHQEKMGDGGAAIKGMVGKMQDTGGQKAIDIAKFTRGGGGGV